MVIEVIDINNSPPSPSPPPPPRPKSSKSKRSPKLTSSSKKPQFKTKKSFVPSRMQMPPCPGVPRDPSSQTHDLFPINSQPQAHHVAVYEPKVATPNDFLFPQRTKLKEPWTPREHELFLMGLVTFGRGSWSKISRDFVLSKTPQQVQSYATTFYKHVPAMCLHNFRKNSSLPPFITSDHLMGPPQTLILFPTGECSNSSSSNNNNNNNNAYGVVANPSTVAVGGEVDLELRLG